MPAQTAATIGRLMAYHFQASRRTVATARSRCRVVALELDHGIVELLLGLFDDLRRRGRAQRTLIER